MVELREGRIGKIGKVPWAIIPDTEIKKCVHYMMFCVGDQTWQMGKITRYNSRRKKFNFDVIWDEAEEYLGVKLAAYHDRDDDPEPGAWAYLKRRDNRTRDRDAESDPPDEPARDRGGPRRGTRRRPNPDALAFD